MKGGLCFELCFPQEMAYIVLGLPLSHIATLSSLTLKMYSWVHILIASLLTINNIVK